MIQSKISAVLQKWSLTREERTILDKYFILYWETEYFLNVSGTGKITKEDIDYLIIYPFGLPIHIPEQANVALSFRKFKSMSYGYVLVKSIPSMPYTSHPLPRKNPTGE
jgi:hypothetical protein